MKRLKGSKMCVFLGLAAVLAAAVFMLQVETVSPGAPAVCKEPCDDETATAEVPDSPEPGPSAEPSGAVGVEALTDRVDAPAGSESARLPDGRGIGAALPVSQDGPPAGRVEHDASAGDGAAMPARVPEAEPDSTVESPAAKDNPAAVRVAGRQGEAAGVSKGQAVEALSESVDEPVTRGGDESEFTRREATAATAAPAELAQPEGTGAEATSPPPAIGTREPEPPWLLAARLRVPAPQGGIPVARGSLGYRVPLVVRQRVPAQIRGGVFIPAHEAYVVLQPGYWEAEDADEDSATAGVPVESPQAARGCWLLRLFRKIGENCDGGS